MIRIAALVLSLSTAAADTCAASATCTTCTAESGCGWCQGKAFDPSGERSPCLPLTNETWQCTGQFKNKGQCECAGTDVPTNLVYPWRGFYIDGSVKGEIALEFTNSGTTQGRAIMKTAGGTPRGGNVTTYNGCPKDVLQFSFDDGAKMACAYRLGWQGGGDAFALALGCNLNASAPADFDEANQTLEMYTCTDPSHCDFKKALAPPAAPAKVAVEVEVEIEVEAAGASAASCEAISTCKECGAAAGCSWCLGRLIQAGKALPGTGHCFGESTAEFSCSGLTLAQDCSVYKCPWFEYYAQTPANCSALTSACGAETTADDPDFKRDYPASAYLSADKCHQSCVDPTVGCTGSTCAKTHTCNASSTCSSCETVDLPAVLQGIQISNNYTAGLWTFAFTLSADKHVYTAVNVTSPAGETTAYTVREYTGATAIFAAGTVEHGVRLDGLSNNGALGKNIYLAMGKTATVPNFGEVMYEAGGSEWALLGCEFDYNGKPISGQYKPLNCKIGSLSL